MVKTLDKVSWSGSCRFNADVLATLTTKLVPMLAKIKTKGGIPQPSSLSAADGRTSGYDGDIGCARGYGSQGRPRSYRDFGSTTALGNVYGTS